MTESIGTCFKCVCVPATQSFCRITLFDVCLTGTKSRIGKKREDLPWVEMDKEFQQWILDFGKDHLPKIYDLPEKYEEGRDVFVFKSREKVQGYLL